MQLLALRRNQVGRGAIVIRCDRISSRLVFFLSALRFWVAVIFKGFRKLSMLKVSAERILVGNSPRMFPGMVVFAIADTCPLEMRGCAKINSGQPTLAAANAQHLIKSDRTIR